MELLHWGPLAQVITKGGTTVNQEIMPAYAAYQKAIDLTLYHAFAELVVQTSQDDKARMHYRQIEAAQIWQQDVDVSIYFEQYSLRYPGEVLERFEEKLGTDIPYCPCIGTGTCRYTHTPRRPDVCGQSA